MCDRAYVLRDKTVVGHLSRTELTEEAHPATGHSPCLRPHDDAAIVGALAASVPGVPTSCAAARRLCRRRPGLRLGPNVTNIHSVGNPVLLALPMTS